PRDLSPLPFTTLFRSRFLAAVRRRQVFRGVGFRHQRPPAGRSGESGGGVQCFDGYHERYFRRQRGGYREFNHSLDEESGLLTPVDRKSPRLNSSHVKI